MENFPSFRESPFSYEGEANFDIQETIQGIEAFP
jgi:hypothetical protein